jgi:hypothetical protein
VAKDAGESMNRIHVFGVGFVVLTLSAIAWASWGPSKSDGDGSGASTSAYSAAWPHQDASVSFVLSSTNYAIATDTQNFYFAVDGRTVMALHADGGAEVNGHPVRGDQAVYDGFAEWWRETSAAHPLHPCPNADGGAP